MSALDPATERYVKEQLSRVKLFGEDSRETFAKFARFAIEQIESGLESWMAAVALPALEAIQARTDEEATDAEAV